MNYSKGLVSVIIPVFNRKNLVEETIKSLFDQSYQQWEAIIVDDGSTDGSWELLQELGKEDHRLKVLQRNRLSKGAQACRNFGMENSKGEYIIFLDSDDLLSSYCLKERVDFMEKNPSLDLAVFNVITFKKVPGDLNILWNIFNEKDDLQRFVTADSPWQTSSPIWRRNFLKNLSWDEGCISGQDWDFHVRALSFKPKYQKVDALPDCFIRRDDIDRISLNFYKVPQVLNRQGIWQRNFKLLKEKGLWSKEWNNNFAAYFFVMAEYNLGKGNFIKAWNFYYPVYRDGLLDLKDFSITAFYLVVLQILNKRNYLRRTFMKFYSNLIPEFLKRENQYQTQEKVKLQGHKLDQLLSSNKNLVNNIKVSTSNN
jgi:glycosyltransferase involved in cell wall biosynthesis